MYNRYWFKRHRQFDLHDGRLLRNQSSSADASQTLEVVFFFLLGAVQAAGLIAEDGPDGRFLM